MKEFSEDLSLRSRKDIGHFDRIGKSASRAVRHGGGVDLLEKSVRRDLESSSLTGSRIAGLAKRKVRCAPDAGFAPARVAESIKTIASSAPRITFNAFSFI